ncbi:MAG: NAD(P)/FAD-dependent oxidoreductase [Eubacteriales bacterium]|nr:NAD(P)/FAD-dependent oxidoreductase [Eubacteriales bacterium]
MSKRVLIVGAGYAGIEAALYLNRKARREDLDICLVDKNPYHTLLTELHEVAANRQDEESVRIPLREIFRDTKVRWTTDEIVSFDFDHNRAVGQREIYDYDYCIIAIGSSPAFYGINGLKEHAFTLWSFDDAVKIREHIRDCFMKARTEKDPEERKRLLTFVVGGAGFTGVEMVGELAIWVKSLCRENNIDRKDVRLVLLDLLDRVLPVLDQKNSAKSHRYMTKRLGIEIMLETNIQEMKADEVLTSRGLIGTRTMIWCAGVCCNEDASDVSISRVGGARRFAVNEYCQTEKTNVYAIGDCGALADENGRPYAAMVENAIQSGEGAAANILRDIHGEEPKKVEVKFHGTMVCIGNYFAVSEIMGKRLPSWLSVIMKIMINAHYLFEIMGLRGPARYLKSELVDRKQEKRFLARHYSPKMQAWWVMPLRMFLGAYWLYEGIVKATQGWFANPKLAEFLGMARNYELSADAVSSASAGGLRLDDIIRINIKLFDFRIGEATQMLDGTAVGTDIFTRLDLLRFGNFSLVPWIIEGWALHSQGWEMFFQIAITLAEIIVGLMLIGGAFTFVAGIGSFALLAMFTTSTGLYMHSWWMIFASIVCMGGAGRAFGMDNYLIPWYTRVWESWYKNRKLKLFFPRKRR